MKKVLISMVMSLGLSVNANAFVGEVLMGVAEVAMPYIGDALFESEERNAVEKANAQKSVNNLKKFFTGDSKTELEKVQDEYEKTKNQNKEPNTNESMFFKVLDESSKEAEKQHQKNVQQLLGN